MADKAEKKSGKQGGSFDIATAAGLFVGIAFIVVSIIVTFPKFGPDVADADKKAKLVINNIYSFFDIGSILIVVGGTLAALMVSYPVSFFAQVPKHLKIAFMPTKFDPKEYIQTIVDIAKPARVEGILSIQNKVEEIPDAFFRNSLNLVIDGVDAEKVKTMMESELDYMDERHTQARGFYAKGSSYAPAFGMIGTLIGLINLLKQLSDPDAIAPAMAIALITTLYGSFLANLVFAPISNKLKVRHDEEMLCKMIVCEGVQAIQAGDNPRFIEDKLIQMLPAKVAATMGEGAGGSSGGEGGGGKKKGKKK